MARTAKEFEAAAARRGIAWWSIRSCSICEIPIGYHFLPSGQVVWDGRCECSSAFGPELRTWEDVAGHYNLQGHPDVIAEYDQYWGFASPTGKESAPDAEQQLDNVKRWYKHAHGDDLPSAALFYDK